MLSWSPSIVGVKSQAFA